MQDIYAVKATLRHQKIRKSLGKRHEIQEVCMRDRCQVARVPLWQDESMPRAFDIAVHRNCVR